MATVLAAFDYVVLIAVLLVSVGIGIYYATFAGGQKTSSEYFLADRSMHWLPVAVSLSVSVVSAITFLGTSALTYYSGPGYWVVLLSRTLGGAITATVITPVFYNLKITSVYEYLEKRFNPVVRYIAVGIHFVSTFLILGVVTYAPAIALNAVTGLSIAGSILAVGIICTFYSAVGGIKAVVWSDFFQSAIMIGGVILIIITAIVKTGGIGEVWSRAREGERTSLIFDFRLDPTIPLSFWANLIGGFFAVVPYVATNQNQAQRYLTCKDLRSAKISVFLGFTLMGVIEFSAVVIGFILFSYYYGCDPLKAGEISNTDQILPYFIVDVFGEIPGLTGFLISAIFSASLSTFSTAINGLTTVTGQAFVRRIWPRLSDGLFTTVMKFVSLTYGVLFMLMAYVASVLGSSVIVIALRITGALMGPVLGIVLLGMLVPRANWKGAIVGVVVGLAIGVWLLAGSIAFPAPSGGGPPVSTEFCSINSTDHEFTSVAHFETPAPIPDDNRAWIYRVSFLYLGFMTTVPTFLLGILVSIATSCGRTGRESIDIKLFSPLLISLYDKIPEAWKGVTLSEVEDQTEMKVVEDDGKIENKVGKDHPAFQEC